MSNDAVTDECDDAPVLGGWCAMAGPSQNGNCVASCCRWQRPSYDNSLSIVFCIGISIWIRCSLPFALDQWQSVY